LVTTGMVVTIIVVRRLVGVGIAWEYRGIVVFWAVAWVLAWVLDTGRGGWVDCTEAGTHSLHGALPAGRWHRFLMTAGTFWRHAVAMT